MKAIGREKESMFLQKLLLSDKSEFLAVYGRRRVGKTFLVDSVFSTMYAFRHSAPSNDRKDNASKQLETQLATFQDSLGFYGDDSSEKIDTWLKAFARLRALIQKKEKTEGKIIIFLDELPWMDTSGSDFLSAFSLFWNNYCFPRGDILLIVCGSSMSYMSKKILSGKGSLFHRVSKELRLTPFTLRSTEEFLQSKGIMYSRYEIACTYMIFGGIPYYLDYLEKGLTLAQNIDRLFFAEDAVFANEFSALMSQSFSNASLAEKTVLALSGKSKGLERDDLCKEIGVADGGEFSDAINGLTASGFIMRYIPFGENQRHPHYKLIDPFCLFYLHFVKGNASLDKHFFQQHIDSSSLTTWRGLTFELVCIHHVEQIKNALGLSVIRTETSLLPLTAVSPERKAQIDLVINRADNAASICEIKFVAADYSVTKDYYHDLISRRKAIASLLKKKQSMHQVLITTFGLTPNSYSSFFESVLTLDDLFR